MLSALIRSALFLILIFVGHRAAALAAQNRPTSGADLALYQGADREAILIEGAKKEGQLTFYTSNTWVAGPVASRSRSPCAAEKWSTWMPLRPCWRRLRQ